MVKSTLAAIALAVALIFPLSIHAQNSPGERTPEEVVKHHLDAFMRHDVDAILSDYADDAIFLAPNQTVQGKAALRKMFESFAANKNAPDFKVKVTADGDVGYEHWVANPGKPNSVSGTDAFVVRHGKILFHTVLLTQRGNTNQQ